MRRHQLGNMLRVVYWSFYAPIWIAKLIYRKTGRLIGYGALFMRDAVRCPACGAAVSLLGRWECAWCGRVFDGFAFWKCPGRECGAVPPFIECQSCGLTIDNPSLF